METSRPAKHPSRNKHACGKRCTLSRILNVQADADLDLDLDLDVILDRSMWRAVDAVE
jgi:hypothetical protein